MATLNGQGMRNYLILIFSLLLVVAGFIIKESQLLMMVGQNGELFRPVSSGGDDPMGIKMGLMSYILTFIFATFSLAFNKGVKKIFGLFIVNSLICAVCFGLVLLDSSIIDAAKAGNKLPIIVYIVWAVSIVTVVSLPFNKSVQPIANAPAD